MAEGVVVEGLSVLRAPAWEYCEVPYDPRANTVETWNALGAENWELVQVVGEFAFFKRSKHDDIEPLTVRDTSATAMAGLRGKLGLIEK